MNCSKGFALGLVAFGLAMTGCGEQDRQRWREGALYTPITHPADLVVRPIILLGLAATESKPQASSTVRVTCGAMALASVPDTPERKSYRGFSIVPPSGWCIFRESAAAVAYAYHPLLNRELRGTATLEQTAQTLLLLGTPIDATNVAAEVRRDLVGFVRTWVAFGRPTESGENGLLRPGRTGPSSRFSLVQSDVAAAATAKTRCADYRLVAEERANPRAPDKILVIRDTGRVCRGKGPTLIAVNFTERHIKDQPAEAGLYDRLLQERAYPFFDSLVIEGSP